MSGFRLCPTARSEPPGVAGDERPGVGGRIADRLGAGEDERGRDGEGSDSGGDYGVAAVARGPQEVEGRRWSV
jgi:hypothetical protein